MSDTLSQEEIDALLNGISNGAESEIKELSLQEIDALKEIEKISLSTSTSALYTLFGNEVTISGLETELTTWDKITYDYPTTCIGVKIEYVNGIEGNNFIIFNEDDVKNITHLVMERELEPDEEEQSELYMSAISEVVNQMFGSAATSISSMINKRIGITQPKAFLMNLKKENNYYSYKDKQKIVKVTFKMIIKGNIECNIIQIIPISFAKELVEGLINAGENIKQEQNSEDTGINTQNKSFEENIGIPDESHEKNIKVQPAQFQAFDEGRLQIEKGNINLIMDVPLQVTVELGRTQKLIKDILELGSGSIIELEKLAGEPVDILVNDKAIAKGEVVVIDESFGVRVTDIVDPSKRI
jgi:flagellar motor switch protein FliN